MWTRQMKLNHQQKYALVEAPILYAKGYPDFPISGLSNYAENVESVRKGLYLNDGDHTQTEAVLVCEPDNPYSQNRTAVAVYVADFKVGYVPNLSSSLFFDVVSSVGGICRAGCRFYYSNEGSSSCRLDVNFPPSFSAPSRNPELVMLEGPETFNFRMRSSKYPIDWSSLKEKESELYLEVGDTYIGVGNLIISEFERSPYLLTAFGIETAKPFQADERLVNRVLATVGGEARVGFALTRTSLSSHSTKLDLDLSKWKEAEKAYEKDKGRKNNQIQDPKPRANYRKRSSSSASTWSKILFGKPKRKKSIWSSIFFGD
jgi:hypothetical protein